MELRRSLTRSNSDIFEQSIVAVKLWLEREWAVRVVDPKLPVHIGTSYNRGDRGVAIQVNRQPSEALAMPNAVIVPVVSTLNRVGFNNFALQHAGLPTGRVNGGLHERREKLTPIELGLGVRFSCVDPNEGFMFDQICKENSPSTRINVVQQSTGHTFKLSLTPDEQINYPSDGATGDNSDRIDLLTTFILRTFAGTSEINRLITKIRHGILDGSGFDPNAIMLTSHETDGYKVAHPERIRALQQPKERN